MTKEKIFLLTGSNLGQREQYLQEANNKLSEILGTPIAVSSLYETAAWGKTDQPAFLNQVLVFENNISVHDLLKLVLATEQAMGRQRQEKWTARNIDIDILFYGAHVIQEQNLQVPHPFLHERRFTLEPLCEIAPQFMHPVLHKTCAQLLADCKDQLEVSKL